MLLAILIGMGAGVWLAFLCSRWLVRRIADRYAPYPQGRSLIRAFAVVFGAIALAPAIFLSVMGTGSLGGRLVDDLVETLGMGGFFRFLVLVLGIVLVILITVLGHVAFGAGLGAFTARSLGGPRPGSGSPAGQVKPG